MKIKNLLFKSILTLSLGFTNLVFSQVPVANFSFSPNPVCSGTANVVQITDLATNTPTAWFYNMPGGVPASSSVQNPTVTYNVAGVYTITMLAANGSGTSTPVAKTITVNASPNLFINPANLSMCFGAGPLNFFANSSVGNYSWSTGATTNSISVSPTVTTIYTCVTTNSATGCSTSRTATANVNPLPVVTITSNPVALCGGGSATLTATGTGGGPYTYTWSGGGGVQTKVTALSGVYICTVTNVNGCRGIGSFTLGTSTSLTVSAVATPTTKCAGNTATLQAFGASSYTWSTGPTTSLTVVAPLVTTTYSVLGVSGSCTGTAVVTLSVVPNPTITAIASSNTVCAGNSVTLTAGGGISYTWAPGGSTLTAVVVTPTAPTIYTVIGTNGYCGRTATVGVMTVANPTILSVANPTGMCAGGTSTLMANGALTYTWNPGALTGSLVVVSPSVTTIYTVSGTNAAGCVRSVTRTVTIYPSPALNPISNPGSLCTGQTATVIASGALSYTWNTGPVSNSIVVTPTVTTSYTVTGINSFGCLGSAAVTVTVGTNPVVNVISTPTMLCIGQTATISASGTTTYSWDTGATTSTIAVSPTITTSYTVLGSNGATCTNIAVFTLSVSTCAGVQQLAKQNNEIRVYPNPNNGQFTISLNSIPVNSEATIYNSLGQLIYREKLTGIDTVINTTQFAKGIYILRITENNSVIKTAKIIRE